MNVSSCGCRSYRSCTSPCPPPLPELLAKTERLKQVVRITGALSINIAPQVNEGQNYLRDLVDAAAAILTEVNAHRTPPATLTLVYYPYYWYPAPGSYPKPSTSDFTDPTVCPPCTAGLDEPPCVDDPRATCFDLAAVNTYVARVEFVKGRLSLPGGPGEQLIGQQFFDTERWSRQPQLPSWNAAVRDKHNLFYHEGDSRLPNAPIYQYNRGEVTFVDSPVNHRYNRVFGEYYTLLPDELGNSYGVSLYIVPDLDRMRASLEATVERARQNAPPNASELHILPWVGLASGVRDIGEHYDENWDYGTRALRDFTLWLRGYTPPAQSNPTIIVSAIGLFPGPFWRGTPHWCWHFIEYVRAYTQQ